MSTNSELLDLLLKPKPAMPAGSGVLAPEPKVDPRTANVMKAMQDGTFAAKREAYNAEARRTGALTQMDEFGNIGARDVTPFDIWQKTRELSGGNTSSPRVDVLERLMGMQPMARTPETVNANFAAELAKRGLSLNQPESNVETMQKNGKTYRIVRDKSGKVVGSAEIGGQPLPADQRLINGLPAALASEAAAGNVLRNLLGQKDRPVASSKDNQAQAKINAIAALFEAAKPKPAAVVAGTPSKQNVLDLSGGGNFPAYGGPVFGFTQPTVPVATPAPAAPVAPATSVASAPTPVDTAIDTWMGRAGSGLPDDIANQMDSSGSVPTRGLFPWLARNAQAGALGWADFANNAAINPLADLLFGKVNSKSKLKEEYLRELGFGKPASKK